jgi:hypothetical protein
MKTIVGYLTEVTNRNFSGLATVVIRTAKNPRRGKRYTAYCEAGFGVRQLVAAFGDVRGGFSKASGEIKAVFAIDDLGLLANVEIL